MTDNEHKSFSVKVVKCINLTEFEKWRAIPASVGSMLLLLLFLLLKYYPDEKNFECLLLKQTDLNK